MTDVEAIEDFLFKPREFPENVNDKSSIICYIRSNQLLVTLIKVDDNGFVEISGKCTTSHKEMYHFKRRYNYDRKNLFLMIMDALIDGRFWCIRLMDGYDHINFNDDRNIEILLTLILRSCF